MAWIGYLENFYRKARAELSEELSNPIADFVILFVQDLTREKYYKYKHEADDVFTGFFRYAISNNVTEVSGEDGLWVGMDSNFLKNIELEILKAPVYNSLIQKLRKLPKAQTKMNGPKMGGIGYPVITYDETYETKDTTLRLETYLPASAASNSEGVNRKVVTEDIRFCEVESWRLYKKIT